MRAQLIRLGQNVQAERAERAGSLVDKYAILASSCECERLFSELGDLLEPRRRSISPQLLAAIQCDRRWIRAGFGSGEVPVKGVISDEEMDAKYGVHKWDIS